MANPLYGQNKQDIKFGQVNLSNEYLQNKLAYSSWNWNDLNLRLAADVTDAKARAGITLNSGDICECLVDGGTGASAITLPPAFKGALTVFRFSVQADGGQNIVFSCAGSDVFEAGTICVPVSNLGDGQMNARRPAYLETWTQTVAVGGGAIVTVASSHTALTIAQTATDNQTAIGAELAFFSNGDATWRFGFLGSELGSGAINATFSTA